MNIFFGTDGWRAILDKEINESSISLVAQAFADYVNQNSDNKTVAIAFDGRRNSEIFARIFSEILSGNNLTVFLSDRIIPTPVLSFTVKEKNCFAGVMITASHNPCNYNGVKFKASYGGPFLTEETKKVEQLISKSPIRKSKSNINEENFLIKYSEHLEKLVDFDSIRRARLIICIDSMGGAGSDFLERILIAHHIPSKSIHSFPDEKFYGRFAEPIDKNLQPLKDELSSGSYSIGVATDGDADRCGIMIENGEFLNAQETILFLSDFVVNHKNFSGDIVKTSSVTDKLKFFFETDNRKVIDVQVGFKHITEIMIIQQVAFGCEESGGFGFGNHIPERDGILSSLFMIEYLAKSGLNKLSELVELKRKSFGDIFYNRIDLHYDHPNRMELLETILQMNIQSLNQFKVNNIQTFLSSREKINGIKFRFDGTNRWLLIRSSETEPIVRIYSEGENNEEVEILLNEAKNLIYNLK